MKTLCRLILIAVFLLAATALFFVTSEREFVSYQPLEGELSGIILRTDTAYQQTFITDRHSISRLSLFLRPVTDQPLPDDVLGITIISSDAVLNNTVIPVSFLNRDGATQVNFSPSLATSPGDPITFIVSAPPALSGLIRVQLVDLVNNPDISDISFSIAGATQPTPLAYQLYYNYRPPLSYQLAIFLLFLAAWLASRRSLLHPLILTAYVIFSTIAFLSPAAMLANFYWSLTLAFILSLTGMLLLLRSYKLPSASIFLGANAFAFSTYFALHAQAGRDKLLIFSLIPLILWFIHFRKRPAYRIAFGLMLLLLLLAWLLFSPYQSPLPEPALVANLKDILLDPNQIATADKFQASYLALQIPQGDPSAILRSGGWDNFGSYIGIINLSLALIGLAALARRYWLITLLGSAGLLLAATPLTLLLVGRLILPPQYLIILLTFALAFFASFGLSKLYRFLGPGVVTSFIVYSITIFALFDLLNVTSKTLQFGLL